MYIKSELYVIKVVNQDMREAITIKGIVAEVGSPDGVSREFQKAEWRRDHSCTKQKVLFMVILASTKTLLTMKPRGFDAIAI